MLVVEHTLLLLLLILLLGLVIPELFERIKIPHITSLILLGALLGPHGFDYVQSNETIAFFGFLGFAFLMFMAGLETHLEKIKALKKNVIIIALLNGGIPFSTGFILSWLFGYGLNTAFLLGAILISTSIAIVIPILRSSTMLSDDTKQLLISAVFIEDVVSLLLLAVIFQNASPVTQMPLFIYVIVLVLSIVVLKILLPKLANYFINKSKLFRHETHEDQLRFVIVVLIAVLAYFSALGVHPILAAFLTGILLSNILTSKKLYTKLHTLSYGLFVPVFFFIIGMDLDLRAIIGFDVTNIIVVSIMIGALSAKLLSGFLASWFTGLSSRVGVLFGTISTVQLTTMLAATYAGQSIGLLDTTLVTGIITLSIFTTIFAPIFSRWWSSS